VDVQATLLFATSHVAIVNPVSSAVLFAATSGNFHAAVQRRMANQSALAILIVLLVVVWAGRWLLGLLGISVAMLQAAGGLILLLNGLRMVIVEESKLTEAEATSVEDVPEAQWKTLAVVPLAIPGTVGAGTITTVIVQVTTYSRLPDLGMTFRSAGPIARRLGPIGLNIATRVMGILVTATAFGMLARGLGGLLPGLTQ